MIPVKLTVRNFMCYRGDAVTLPLDHIHLACLSGENGAGKSALLGAMTWALWGKARDRVSDDELISMGATEMEVDFEFMLDDLHYRVIRKRIRKPHAGVTVLELQMADADDPESWHSLTGHAVRDTEAKICSLLKMEYETFINSAFIVQGRADEFTVKGPRDRKQILGNILGLGEYDELAARSREEVQKRKQRVETLQIEIDRLDGELLESPNYERQLEALRAELKTVQGAHEELRTSVRAVRSRLDGLEESARRLRDLQAIESEREDEMEEARERIAANNVKKQELEDLLAERALIEQGYRDLQAADAESRRMDGAQMQLLLLQKEQQTVSGEISMERTRLDGERKALERQLVELTRAQGARPGIERQLAEVSARLEQMARLQEEHEDARCQVDNQTVKMQMLVQERDHLQKEGGDLRDKLQLLIRAHEQGKDGDGCPLCGTGLTADALGRVQASYEADITRKREQYLEKKAELKLVNEAIVAATGRRDELAKQLKVLPDLQQKKAAYTHQLEQLARDEQTIAHARQESESIAARLGVEDYAHEARARLSDVEGRIAALGYSPAAHSTARERLAALQVERFEERYHKLEGAERQLASVEQFLKVDGEKLAKLKKESERDSAEIAALKPKLEQLEAARDAFEAKECEERDLAGQIQTMLERQGGLRGKLADCERFEAEKKRVAGELAQAKAEKSIHEDLATAFGKNGIQAMIIENVLPDLEDEANSLLARMTDGRMSVQFATQRDAKTGRSVIETLDINISDEMGSRAYELYSGGEAFRVNFAVRVALSKLLATRAGAQLQMLVIDEGFGTQDGQGREKLVGAIRSIQDDFKKVLVVTHIEELKGEFPVRIDVVKGDTGSRVLLN